MEISLESFITRTAEGMRSRNQYSMAKTCISVLHGLSGIAQNKSLTFSDLTPELLATYEYSLIISGRSRNTVSLYMRTSQNICNRAKREGVATTPDNLFDKVFTGNAPVRHRAVTPEVIQLISSVELVEKQARLQFSRDMFMLCFYLQGIAYIDLAHLRKCDLKDGILSLWRHKTGKSISLKVHPRAMEIIERYASSNEDTAYLLPIIRKQGTAAEEQKQYNSALRLHNKHLKVISTILKLDTHLTSYIARHSWATIAHDIGVQMSDISEALCHSSEQMTRNYIRSFSIDRLAGTNQKVIAYVIDKDKNRDRDRTKNRSKKKHAHKKRKGAKKKRSGSL